MINSLKLLKAYKLGHGKSAFVYHFYIRSKKLARSEALKKAQNKYAKTHKEIRKKVETKSAGKRFILKYATKQDLLKFMELIKKRMQEIGD